jgi:predicted enzyme related to lactoylglutathione lyase
MQTKQILTRLSGKRSRKKGKGKWYLAFFIIGLITISSCVSKKLLVPPITSTPTGTYYPGKFVWMDLLTDKVPEVKKFYGELLGWEFEGEDKADAPYTLIKFEGKPIGGIVYTDLKKGVNESQWLSYLSVPDVDQAAEYVQTHGGKVYRQPWDLNDRGRLSVVADPEGALLVLFKAIGGDPADHKPEIDEWLWNELLTSDVDSALAFYKGLAGYNEETTELTPEHKYHMLLINSKPRAGIVKIPFENVKPNWLPYVRVEDPAALVKKVEALGGRVYLAPTEEIRKGSIAVIIDPSGAAMALQRWPI